MSGKMNSKAYTPEHLQIVERDEEQWYFLQPSRIVSPCERILDSDFFTCRERKYGLTKAKMALEFRLLTGGKLGYYLADMKRKRYYYCGEQWEGVRSQLLELGIGKVHPLNF
jgi:hypothetical protein